MGPRTATMPACDEIGSNDVLVQTLSKPDNLGRVRFAAFWIDDYLPPNGVRGQVFNTLLAKFTADCERDGKKVRHWNPKEGVL